MDRGIAPRRSWRDVQTTDGVYAPQDDSKLLIETLDRTGLAAGRRLLDLCTGSGVAAIAAAEFGAADITAVDICPRAVRCSRHNARDAHVAVTVRKRPWQWALECAPFEVVVANPPYVPTPAGATALRSAAGPAGTWNGGVDGRAVLNPLCESAPRLLVNGGSMLLVHSALANPHRSLTTLRSTGLVAGVIAVQWVVFGPVLSQRAAWLERTGKIQRGCREEQLVVIRADKP